MGLPLGYPFGFSVSATQPVSYLAIHPVSENIPKPDLTSHKYPGIAGLPRDNPALGREHRVRFTATGKG